MIQCLNRVREQEFQDDRQLTVLARFDQGNIFVSAAFISFVEVFNPRLFGVSVRLEMPGAVQSRLTTYVKEERALWA